MRKQLLKAFCLFVLLQLLMPIAVMAFDQHESMKVGETKTFYFPSEVTSRASSMYAYNCTSDYINNVEIVSYTNTSVTVKAIAYTKWTVHIRFDYWWYEHGYSRSDTHTVNIDLNDTNYNGSSSENPWDYDFDYGSWGTINIKVGETATVYSNISTPNPDKLVSVIWSNYNQFGYEITSQSWSSCTIKGRYAYSGEKLWCLWKYGNSTYKTYYTVNVTGSSTETLSLSAEPSGGKVKKNSKVYLTASSSGANIYYTTNGETPTTSSTKYSSAITISNPCTIKAFARKSGYNDSPVKTWVFTIEEDKIVAEINASNFPDENFRNYLLNEDYGKDGKLSSAEISEVKSISVFYSNIASLKGIEFFSALTYLNCQDNQLTALDVSKNTALTDLSCEGNQLTSLDVSKNTALTDLNCSGNQLTSLDVSKNTALTDLNCSGNQLTALDVSKNTRLRSLYCSGNQLTALDVSKNTALTDLSCYGNKLTALDVSKNTALTYLYCYDNQLTALDVSKNTALTYLYCYDNQLTALDVSKNTRLTTLDCSYNQLSSLDVLKNTALTTLHCENNQLKGQAIDKLISGFPNNSSNNQHRFYVFRPIEGEGNVCTKAQVAAAKVKGWTPLYYNGIKWIEFEGYDNESVSWTYNVSANDFIEINDSNFPDEAFRNLLLRRSYGVDGILTATEISKIEYLYIGWGSRIASLIGIEHFTALTSLDCDLNHLTALDVSKNTALSRLWCRYNQLTALDVSNTALTSLLCYCNQIRGQAMDKLISSLPINSSGELYEFLVLYPGEKEGNVCTKSQVAAAKAKGWTPMYYNGTEWVEYEGSDELVQSISLPVSATVNVGETITLTPTLTPADANTTLEWSSDDTSIAKVSQSGIVMGLKAGTAIITVKTSNGLMAECFVKVEDPSGINDIRMDSENQTPVYNLGGQRLAAPQKGINIIGGKKVVVK